MLHRLRWLIVVPLGTAPVTAAEPNRREKEDVFERRIQPVLVRRCYQCHSGKSKKLQGGLRVDSRADLLKGGDTGRAIVPGDPRKSPLIEALRYGADSFQMPPDRKLPANVIGDFELWLRHGAIWPEDETDRKTQGDGKSKFVITP